MVRAVVWVCKKKGCRNLFSDLAISFTKVLENKFLTLLFFFFFNFTLVSKNFI